MPQNIKDRDMEQVRKLLDLFQINRPFAAQRQRERGGIKRPLAPFNMESELPLRAERTLFYLPLKPFGVNVHGFSLAENDTGVKT